MNGEKNEAQTVIDSLRSQGVSLKIITENAHWINERIIKARKEGVM